MAKRVGNIAKITRDNLEKELGRTVVTKENTLNYQYIDNVKEIENKIEWMWYFKRKVPKRKQESLT